MLKHWLENRREELLAISLAFEHDQSEPLDDGVLYPLLETTLTAAGQALDGKVNPTRAAVKIAQHAQDARLPLPGFIHSLDVLRRAAQYLLGQDVHAAADQLAWMGALNDQLFLTAQVAATMLGSGTEAELAEERHRLRTLVDALPDFVFMKDRDSRFLLLNRAMAQFMGAETPQEIIGKDDFDLFPEVLAAQYRADEMEVMQSGRVKTGYEEQTVTREGEIRWMQSTKAPLRDGSGNVIGVVGMVRDITAIKQAHERERQQRQIIEAQQQAISELSTPIIPVMDRIIVMPLIGGIDTARARDIMRSLLAGIGQYRARIAILDITGVPVVDSGVAQHLDRTIQAARLKGAQTIVTGVSDAIAETIVDLGIDWSGVETERDLQTGLVTALERLGFVLIKPGSS
jgi:rsbT co-antagonist protein RsbR